MVKAPGASPRTTVAGKLVGTVAFMSPEQITGDPVTPASDLSPAPSLRAATLRRPIEADNIAGYLPVTSRRHRARPRTLIPTFPHLESICQHPLKKEPNQRPASASMSWLRSMETP